MKWPAYPKYKDSGIEWLGEVPEHWVIVPYKRVCTRVDVGIAEAATHAYCDDGVPIIRSTNVKPNRLDTSDVLRIEPWFAMKNRSKTLRSGDLVTVRTGHPGTTAIVPPEFDGCQCFTLVASSPMRTAHGPFFSWVLNSGPGSSYFEMEGWGTAQTNISVPIVQFMPIPRPPLPEQHAIASFLDRETGRIDLLVSKKRTLIERLKEKRTALISRTVTRGLPPAAARAAGVPENPTLKPSGIEWLGDVPEGWEVMQLRHAAQILDCKHRTVQFIDDGIPVASIREVHGFEVDLKNANRTSEEEYHSLIGGGRRPKIGDLIYSRNATVGDVALVTTDEAFCMGQDVCLIRSQNNDPRFMLYLLRSEALLQQLESLMIGSTFRRINVGQIHGYWTCIPPLPEQQAIAAFLDAETAKLDALVAKVEAAIERLLEYRTALITAAVTGKIDVRGSAA